MDLSPKHTESEANAGWLVSELSWTVADSFGAHRELENIYQEKKRKYIPEKKKVYLLIEVHAFSQVDKHMD